MRGRGRIGGWVLIGIGVLVGLFPFVSVWRVSGEVLDQLPDVAETEISDQRRGASALFDDDFVLATRTYTGASIVSVHAALVADGFVRSGDRFNKPCCGESDAVWTAVERADPESVVATLTVADSDWQAAWKVYAIFALLVVLAGVASLRRGDQWADRVPEPA